MHLYLLLLLQLLVLTTNVVVVVVAAKNTVQYPTTDGRYTTTSSTTSNKVVLSSLSLPTGNHNQERRKLLLLPSLDTHVRGGGDRNNSSYHNYNTIQRSAMLIGLKNAMASGLATACAKTLLAPFDTIKTVQQQSRATGADVLKFWGAAKIIINRNPSLNRLQSLSNLYSGLTVAVVGAMPSVGLYFGVYAYCKKSIGHTFPYINNLTTVALSAAIGNTVASFSRVPYEVVKQKLQTGEYSSTIKALTSMYAHSGFRAFFPLGGISSQMVRDIPYAIFTLMTYEWLRENWVKPKDRETGKPSVYRNMAVGAIAGAVGTFLTNPMDVIKTRLQTGTGDATIVYYSGVRDCFTKTLQAEGFTAFLKGAKPRLLHKIPANAAFFVSYEFFRRLLRVEHGKNEEGKKVE